MAKDPAFIFDLDMTLVDSERAEQLRGNKQWKQIIDNVNKYVQKFNGFKIPPHEIPGLLIKKGFKVGIVTNTPRNYALSVIRQFNIEHNVLIAREDVNSPKPSPDSIQKALLELKADSQQTFYIGDDPDDDVLAGMQAGVKTIFVIWGKKWPKPEWAPDIIISESETLLDLNPSQTKSRYILESILEGKNIGSVDNTNFLIITQTLEKLRHSPTFYGLSEDLPLSDERSCENTYILALGRYYSNKDPRKLNSRLSEEILRLKEGHGSTALFASSLANTISFIKQKNKINPITVTCVPPNHNKSNRFEPILNELKNLVDSDIIIEPNGLKTIKEIPDYKKYNHQDREQAIKGKYESTRDWKGLVLLIDDVYTSGSTIRECVSVIKNNGASQVIGIVFGVTQDVISPKKCPICGSYLVIKKNRKQGSPGYGKLFWGCSNWKNGSGCRYTEEHEP